MGQDQETPVLDAVADGVCRLVDRQYAGQRARRRILARPDDGRRDVLRADDGHLDAAVAVGDRERFREGDRGMLGRAVGRITRLAQQSRGRGDIHEAA